MVHGDPERAVAALFPILSGLDHVGRPAYLLLVGLNIEISMMFAVAGVVFAKLLPEDQTRKILGSLVFPVEEAIYCGLNTMLEQTGDSLPNPDRGVGTDGKR